MATDENKYLKNYDIAKYDRPSIAADIAIFSIMNADNQPINNRKLPQRKLKILLVKRGNHPYEGLWALPGGFCKKNEDVYDTARRELFEETNMQNVYLQLCGIFGDANRDPRGWIISHTFMALTDAAECNIQGGSDVKQAKWFDIDFQKIELNKNVYDDFATVENEYLITLTSGETELFAKILEKKEFKNYHETTKYEIRENNGFAFDHSKIITFAILSLRNQAEADGKIVFDLMSEYFTFAQLQQAFEIILDKKLLVANFRRKMADYVTETDQIINGVGHRPAKLFKRNLHTFYFGK